MTTPTGFAPIFAGWNVWSMYQATKPDLSIFSEVWQAGESPERRLQVWVEDRIKEAAPGSAVADPTNPAALRGDQIQIIPSPGTLKIAATRADVPNAAAISHLGEDDAQGSLTPHYVRFFNRGAETTMPWPFDKNFLLDVVYQPDSTNPITSSPAPSSLAGGASDFGQGIQYGIKMGGYALGAYVLIKLLGALRGK